jgi:ribosome-binding protein aMBF1 (putative translation factor)
MRYAQSAMKEKATMDSDDEPDDLEALIQEFSAADPEFPLALAAAEERLAIMMRLKAARKAARLSRAAVAARMGTSESAVARMEGGALDARISTVVRFAAAVGVRLQVTGGAAGPPRKAA